MKTRLPWTTLLSLKISCLKTQNGQVPQTDRFLTTFFHSKTHVVRHFGGSPPRVMFSPGGIFHHFPGVNFATIWLENWFIPWVWIEGLEYGFWYFWRCLDFVAQRGQKFWFCDHNFWEKYSIYLVWRNIISIKKTCVFSIFLQTRIKQCLKTTLTGT